MPKFIASQSLEEPLEGNATLIRGDVAEEVSKLKTQLEGDLLMYSCGELARYLVQHGLVDEIRLWVHPVVRGPGQRPFHDGEAVAHQLLDSTSFASGVTLQHYRPANHGESAAASRS